MKSVIADFLVVLVFFYLLPVSAKFDIEEFRKFRDIVIDEGEKEFEVMMEMLTGAAADIDGMWINYGDNVKQVFESNFHYAIQK